MGLQPVRVRRRPVSIRLLLGQPRIKNSPRPNGTTPEERHRSCNFLKNHPLVSKIKYAGDVDHPRHHIMRKNATGCSGMMGFWIKDGTLENATLFLQNLKVFTLAESLGGFKSLAEHPALMTHASVPESEREILEIGDNFIRLSVGIEDEASLVNDLDQALKAPFA